MTVAHGNGAICLLASENELVSFFLFLFSQEIDGDSFLLLTQADIVKIMNVKLGPALKIFNSIVLFQQTTESW